MTMEEALEELAQGWEGGWMSREEVEAALEGMSEGYRTGVGMAGARLMGVVAAELGYDHPLLERMLVALGEVAGAGPPGHPDNTEAPPPSA